MAAEATTTPASLTLVTPPRTSPSPTPAPPARRTLGSESRTGDDWDLPPPAVPTYPTPVGGRLGIFWPNWTILEDPYVSEILHLGYQLPVSKPPPLTKQPRSSGHPPNQEELLAENIDILLQKQAIEEVLDGSPGLYSPVFLIRKKGSTKMRMIHNMAHCNKHYLRKPPHFRLSNLKALRLTVKPMDWLASLDIQDAYLHVPIYQPHRKYLRFIFRGRHFQWRVLPFGISWAPWLFARITSPITKYLHLRRVQFEPYFDDCLMNNQDRELQLQHIDFTLRLMKQLGWLISEEKSHLIPSRQLQYIGGLFQTDRDVLRVPEDRWEKIVSGATWALRHPLSLRQWQALLGLLTSAQELTARGRLMLRPLQKFLIPIAQKGDLEAKFRLPNHLHRFLQWWTILSNVCTGVSLSVREKDLELYVDASLQGWGAHLSGQTTSGLWTQEQSRWHINSLEFQALILAVEHWRELLEGRCLLIASDNATVVWYVRNQGSTRSARLLEQTFQFYRLVDDLNLDVKIRHIPGCSNILADALSRPARPAPTEWMLHRDVFEQLCQHFHRPMIDLFATSQNHRLPVYVSPVPDPAAYAVDALAISWEGLDAYAFPPPVLLPRVIQKIRQTKQMTLLLVAPWWPARVWFPGLRELATGSPVPLPGRRDLLLHPHSRQRHPDPDRFHLHVWRISRKL